MPLTKERKHELITKYGKSDRDSGTPEVQIAILTASIGEMTEHFSRHPSDNHSRMGLLRLVGKRRKLLEYLQSKNPERYRRILDELALRK
jgi:small subunit ribosomal protein S15